MAKLVVAKLKCSKNGEGTHTIITEKRTRRSDTGQVSTVRKIDGRSKTFAPGCSGKAARRRLSR